jgi:YD repeat-containing protein
MSWRICIWLLLIAVFVSSVSVFLVDAESLNYVYDDLNRLIRIEYEDGRVQQFMYDELGNRQTKSVQQGVCTYSISPIIQGFPVAGGNGSVSVTTGPSCPWSAASDESWITVTSGATGTGSGTVNYSVASFSGSSPRNGALTAAGQTEMVRQMHVTDTTAPSGSVLIDSGAPFANNTSVTLALTCTDNLECFAMQFSNDNVTYSAQESYSPAKTWTLTTGSGTKTVYARFRDTAGNWSSTYSDSITLQDQCSSSTIRIGATPYSTLQAAYNAATDGATIQCQGVRFTGNLLINRNISVTLQGGYDCGFTAPNGNMSVIKGAINTTAGGGTITIRNFMLENR